MDFFLKLWWDLGKIEVVIYIYFLYFEVIKNKLVYCMCNVLKFYGNVGFYCG